METYFRLHIPDNYKLSIKKLMKEGGTKERVCDALFSHWEAQATTQ